MDGLVVPPTPGNALSIFMKAAPALYSGNMTKHYHEALEVTSTTSSMQ
jgi:hypothetical protein